MEETQPAQTPHTPNLVLVNKNMLSGSIGKLWWLVFIFVLLMTGWFCWFEIRPAIIRKHCDQVAWQHYGNILSKDRYDWKYSQCLHSEGLK